MAEVKRDDKAKIATQDEHRRRNQELSKLVRSNRVEEVVRLIRDGGANIHEDALVTAAEKGYEEMVKRLLELGANIHAEDGKAFTQACKFSHIPVLELLVKQGNTTRYGGEWLKTLSQNAVSEPDPRVVEIIVLSHQRAILNRYDRIAEQRQFVTMNDEFKPHKRYDKALGEMKQESTHFVATFDDPAPEATTTAAASTLPSVEAMERLNASFAPIVEQMKTDKRAHAVGVATLALQAMQLFAIGLFCYHHTRVSASKLLPEKSPSERERLKQAHTKMQRHLGNYLGPLLPKISQIVHFMMELVKNPTPEQ